MIHSNPNGTPLLKTQPLVTTLEMQGCVSPLAFYRRMRALHPLPGHCLFESAGPETATSRRSIVAARSLIRLELRGEVARFEALVEAGLPLLEKLAEQVPAAELSGAVLMARYPSHRCDGGSDEARLATPGVLDALRTLAGALGDDREGLEASASVLPAGIFGAIGYEIVDQFETLPARGPDPLCEPDASFVLVSDSVVFDRAAGAVHVVSRPLPTESADSASSRHERYQQLLREPGLDPEDETGAELPPSLPLKRDIDIPDADFLAGVAQLQEEIAEGEIFQGVLSRGFACESDADSVDVYRQLTRHNPSPYMFHMDVAEGCLFGASPETYLRVVGREVEIRPIAGTIARGFGPDGTIDPDTDERLALQLLLDTKEQAEHAMLLDLARNDVARVCAPGTMSVLQQMGVEKYRHVQHLVSRVRGELREGFDALHAYRAAANMGTLTGAPKLRAMESIRKLEPHARGFYGGAAGYLLQDGTFDSCIVIRSMRQKGATFYVRAGAGVVAASDPARELEETEIKARACLDALARTDALQRHADFGKEMVS